MADQQQLKRLLQGVEDWNAWRTRYPDIHPDLKEANLNGADLNRADLSGADLSASHLWGADLREADLSASYLREANLNSAILSEADLSEAIVELTIFGNVDLRTVKGLETINHDGPSTIGTDTLLRSEGDIPETFLREAGLTETFITYVHSLAQNPIEYYTCFISVRLVSPKPAKVGGWAGKEYSFHN